MSLDELLGFTRRRLVSCLNPSMDSFSGYISVKCYGRVGLWGCVRDVRSAGSGTHDEEPLNNNWSESSSENVPL